jgi:hypothetical protein
MGRKIKEEEMKILLQILCKLSYGRKSDANKGEKFFPSSRYQFDRRWNSKKGNLKKLTWKHCKYILYYFYSNLPLNMQKQMCVSHGSDVEINLDYLQSSHTHALAYPLEVECARKVKLFKFYFIPNASTKVKICPTRRFKGRKKQIFNSLFVNLSMTEKIISTLCHCHYLYRDKKREGFANDVKGLTLW